MLLIKHLIYLILLLHLVIASPQINLHLTNWENDNRDDIILQHDCLYVTHSTETPLSHQIISYCLSESSLSNWIIENNFDPAFTFDELHQRNITGDQLYRWSAPMDVSERYQLYLNELSMPNISSIMGTELFYNCTFPKFGPQCQYFLDIDPLYPLSLNEIINNYYRQPYEPKTLTCYSNLQCNRGSTLICLDWSEICDGKVDCTDGIDEENCFPLMNNKCQDGEYRCDNGQCIPETFVNDGFNSFECLDRSDERRISLMPSRYEHGAPTFEKEDVICSWREELTNNFMKKSPFTSSCVNERHSIIEKAIFSDESAVISADCLLAFKCHSKVPTYNSSLCSNFCEGRLCIEIMNNVCPSRFYYPNVPIAYGHIYFLYTKQYLMDWENIGQIPPEYICYNEQLCDGFYSNRTFSIDGHTCRHPEDFPVSFGISRRDWYFNYVVPLFSQLSHCNRMVHNSSVVCNSSTMYQCKNSSKCIPKSYVGDGIRDCDYKDDEEQATIDVLCWADQSNTFFKCQTENKCIHRNQVENGKCNCQMDEYGVCDDENLKLNEMKRKICFSTTCDSFVDLLPITINQRNYTDETDCEQWPCNNTYTRCDGFWNCPDGADEIDCNPSPLIKCLPYHHICVSPETNQLMCLPIARAGDGIIDCLGGTDEPTLCPVTDRDIKEKKFYCKQRGNIQPCISSCNLCNAVVDCVNGDDEQFCYNNLNITTIFQNLFRPHLTNDLQPKTARFSSDKSKLNVMTSYSSTINQSEQRCQRGLPLGVVLNANTNLYTKTCLCLPSYYGDRCQYQSQRVALTMQLNTIFYSQHIPFVLVISLIDDSFERVIHSYQQLNYFYMKDQNTKFNFYLLYSDRPKDSTKQYSIHIDIYERISLNHRGSLLIPLKFPFLPVERIAIKINIPDVNNIVETCTDRQCVHGKCVQYLNDPKHTSFCRCDTGWTGRYCTIPHMCTCSSDSLCVGVAANNRSICVCPINKFGSQCLLTHNICQSDSNDGCQNGGQCIPSGEYDTSRYICICPIGFSGDKCEISDTTMILSFHRDIVFSLPSFIIFHFIHLIDNTLRTHNRSLQIICENETSVQVQWSHPFHIAFVELSAFQYYFTFNQKVPHQSSFIVRTIDTLDRCRSINEIFNESMIQMHLIRRIKYYHLPCQNRSLNLSCFYDEVHMCLCQTYNEQRLANCFEFNHHTQHDELDFDNNRIDRVCPSDSTSTSSFSSTSSTSSFSSTPSTSPTDSGMSSIHACKCFLYLFMLLFCFI
jgi:hypothetical protein